MNNCQVSLNDNILSLTGILDSETLFSDTKPVVQEFLDSGALLSLVTEVRQLRAENEVLRCQLTEVTDWAEKALATLRKIKDQEFLDR